MPPPYDATPYAEADKGCTGSIFACDIERLAGLLRPLTEVTKEEKQQHIEDLKTKCPFCGQPLVMRHGRNGAFWGYSSYPKCRYTRPLD